LPVQSQLGQLLHCGYIKQRFVYFDLNNGPVHVALGGQHGLDNIKVCDKPEPLLTRRRAGSIKENKIQRQQSFSFLPQ
jgi:hypothetical protein